LNIWGGSSVFWQDVMDAAGVVIRPVEPKDKAAIAQLWQALVEYHVQIDARQPKPVPGAARRYASRLIEQRDDPYTRTFVAQVDGRVVGYVLGAVVDLHADLFEQADSGFIADIFVDPGYRRHGIGRRLVEAINAWFQVQGVRYTELQVAAANGAGIAFWESVGGQPVMVRMQVTWHAGVAERQPGTDPKAHGWR
jgi:ribosomal protein S18 acetylase RimI-like enzyme